MFPKIYINIFEIIIKRGRTDENCGLDSDHNSIQDRQSDLSASGLVPNVCNILVSDIQLKIRDETIQTDLFIS